MSRVANSLSSGQQVHDGAFAHICISDQGNTHQRTAVAALAGHLTVDLLELVFEAGYAVQNDTTVGLQLALTGTPHVDTASLALEVGPHTRQAGQQILVLGQLDLRLGVGRTGALGKDVQDQSGTVYNAAVGLLFYVAHLGWAQFVVKDHIVDIVLLDILLDLFELALAEICAGERMVQPLGKPFLHDDVGRLCKKDELVQILFALLYLVFIADYGRYYCRFNGFLHMVSIKKVAGYAGHLFVSF